MEILQRMRRPSWCLRRLQEQSKGFCITVAQTYCLVCCHIQHRLENSAAFTSKVFLQLEEWLLIILSFLSFEQYSGFQQTADKCFVCGHLIMEMVRDLNP